MMQLEVHLEVLLEVYSNKDIIIITNSNYMDLSEIVKAAENDNNSHILNLTTVKIHKMKNNILNEIQLTKVEKMEMMKKLKKYRYVDELKHGGYIRWINITQPDHLFLTNGAIFCDFKINDGGVMIIYKNFYGKTYEFKMEESIIFQKLSYQEEVLLKVMDKLNG